MSGPGGGAAPVLEVSGLNSYYGRAHILRDLGLAVAAGEVLAVLGRNGAGKSTTLKSIIGLVRPGSGRVRFRGRDLAGQEPHRIARQGIGYVPEDRRVFADLTVMENLEVGRRAPRDHRPAWTPERVFALFPNLGRMRDRPGNRMSGGEQQMLTIARTLMGNPALVLLDEPSEGLAPVVVAEMAAAIGALKRDGLSVLLAEQNPHFAGTVADRAVILEGGAAVWEGTMPALRADEAARRRHLAV